MDESDGSYPVKLQMQQSSEGPADARWYEDVTRESDAAFEARVQGFYKAVLARTRDHDTLRRFSATG